jgi:hypothetical protein
VLLRRGPTSGTVNALLRYSHKIVRGRRVIEAHDKQDVTADFLALMLEGLIDPGAPDIVAILDGVALGLELDDGERVQVRAFRERLREACELHNTIGHGSHEPVSA